jgi:hypothetical protein
MRPATSLQKDRTGQAEMQIYFWPSMASDVRHSSLFKPFHPILLYWEWTFIGPFATNGPKDSDIYPQLGKVQRVKSANTIRVFVKDIDVKNK